MKIQRAIEGRPDRTVYSDLDRLWRVVVPIVCGLLMVGAVMGALGLAVSLSGCVSVPPGREAEAMRDEIVDIASSFRAVAEAQLADADPGNDAKARSIRDTALVIEAALTNPDMAMIALAARIKDPYAAALATYALKKIERWQDAEKAAALAAEPPPPGGSR